MDDRSRHAPPEAAIETRKVVWSKHGWIYEIVVDPDGLEFTPTAKRSAVAIRYHDSAPDMANGKSTPHQITIDGGCLPYVVLALIQLLAEEAVDVTPDHADLLAMLDLALQGKLARVEANLAAFGRG